MAERVSLVGLDFGTTTSSAVVASAEVVCNSVTGRRELGRVRQEYQAEPVFTPLVDDHLDEARLSAYLDQWLEHVDRSRVFGGGALITGLAAQRANAAALARLVRQRLTDAVIAVGGDPHLESWLAFMGNCAELSRAHGERAFLNVDIGGGTTNLALGRRGEVLRTGSYFVGARHLQVSPGSYRIERISAYAQRLLEHLRIAARVGDELSPTDVLAIVDWYLDLLEGVAGGRGIGTSPVAALHQQAAFEFPADAAEPAITLSGGVGQLVYAAQAGAAWPATTAFGDLGIDLARRLAERPFWQAHLKAFRPTALGRATVYGLLRYNTQVSGNTMYLPDPAVLPLPDLIILGTAGPDTPPAEVDRLVALAAHAPRGGCLRVALQGHESHGDKLRDIRAVAAKIRQALGVRPAVFSVPLVLLMRENLGKVLGQYVTGWGSIPVPVVVVDELARLDGQFAHVGPLADAVVPVSIYGMGARTSP